MTARNLKIRITVGHDEGRQPRRATAPPSSTAEQLITAPPSAQTARSASTSKLPRWLPPALIVGVSLGGLWLFLAGSEPSGTEPVARSETKSTVTRDHAAPSLDPENQRASTAAPPNFADEARPAGAVGAPNLAADTGSVIPPEPANALARAPNTEAPKIPTAGATSTNLRSQETASGPEGAGTAESPVSVKSNLSPTTSDKVARATFATAVARLEPVERLEGELSSGRGLARLHYFTELRGLNGQRIVHRWLVNGQRIADIPVTVTSDRFRASSNMRLGKNRTGTWEVHVVDSQGTVLHTSRLEYH